MGIRQVGVGPDLIVGEQANMPLDPEVKVTVVGFDKHFTYVKLN